MEIPVYKIDIPEYALQNRPDFEAVGAKIDTILKKHFLGQKIIVRAVGSQEHLGKTSTELVDIIKTIGTDHYDPTRQGDRYENIEGKHIDFFALEFEISEAGEYFKFLIEPFYLYPSQTRNSPPIRIDIAIIYNPDEVEVVEHQYEGREGEIKKDGYIFKDKINKNGALKAIIHIL